MNPIHARRTVSMVGCLAAAAAFSASLIFTAGAANASSTGYDDDGDRSYHCDWGGNGYGCPQYGYGHGYHHGDYDNDRDKSRCHKRERCRD